MGTTKKVPRWTLSTNLKAFAKKFPDLREHSLGSRDLEVVDINDEKNSKVGVKEARRPVRDRNEPAFEAMSVTVLLPE